MKTNKNTHNKIEDTFKALETLERVELSPFFKEKTMQRIFSKKEKEPQQVWSWFTPKLQLATLVCLLSLNAIVLKQLSNNTYSTNVNQFAESYELSIDIETTKLN